MTLLAEWGKLYQVTSKVGGYGVITDEAELSRTTTTTLPCHVQYFIYVYGYSLLLPASPSLLCMMANGQGDAVLYYSRNQGRPDCRTTSHSETSG